MADGHGGSLVTEAHARGAHHADRGSGGGAERGKQRLGAGHRACDAVANADRHGRYGRFTFPHDVEMSVEGRGLEDLCQREPHFLRQSREMFGRDLMMRVLDPVQMLDQQIPPPRRIAEERPDGVEALGIDMMAALGQAATGTAASGRPVERQAFSNFGIAFHHTPQVSRRRQR